MHTYRKLITFFDVMRLFRRAPVVVCSVGQNANFGREMYIS